MCLLVRPHMDTLIDDAPSIDDLLLRLLAVCVPQLMTFFFGFWTYVSIELGLTDPRNMGTGLSPANEKNIMRQ